MKNSQKTLALAVGSAFALTMATASVNAAENPFEATTLSSGYQVAEHGKEGEGKCGAEKAKAKEGTCGEKGKEGKCGAEKAKDGKCGTGKCGAEKAKAKAKDGKCGTGKCGNTH